MVKKARPLWKPHWQCPYKRGLENYLRTIPEVEIKHHLLELIKGNVRNPQTIKCLNLNGVPLNNWSFRVESAKNYAEAAKFHLNDRNQEFTQQFRDDSS
jgi:hypothetical protein